MAAISSTAGARIPRVPRPFNRSNQNLTQAEKAIVFSDHYCCFAVPLYNAGIYAILGQFTVFGFVFGILAFSAPTILAIVLDFAFTAFFGVLCLLIGLAQGAGFYGVYKEKPAIFKKYCITNFGLLLITFLYCLILLVISSTKHQTAIEQCLLQFVSGDEFTDGASNSSKQVCSIWTYAQLGICFFLWCLFFFSEMYFCYMARVWGKDQKLDHIKYQSIISAARQSMATSHQRGLLDEDDWQSRSRAGSMDFQDDLGTPRHSRNSSLGEQFSSANGRSQLAHGGSRLKNEIEWKEIEEAAEDQKLQTKTERQLKLKEVDIDEEIIEVGDPVDPSPSSSTSGLYRSHPGPPGVSVAPKPTAGNWIESIDSFNVSTSSHPQRSHHIPPRESTSKHSLSPMSRPLPQSSSTDYAGSSHFVDQEYYKSK